MLRKGTDRTDSQAVNKRAVFSRELYNIISMKRTLSNSAEKNCAVIGGQGEGDDRIITHITDTSATGYMRKELWVDARDISQTVDGTTLSIDSYKKLLRQRGREKLSECARTDCLEGTYRINEDMPSYLMLGDICTIYDSKLSVKMDVPLIGIDRKYSSTGNTVSLQFGTGKPNVVKK